MCEIFQLGAWFRVTQKAIAMCEIFQLGAWLGALILGAVAGGAFMYLGMTMERDRWKRQK